MSEPASVSGEPTVADEIGELLSEFTSRRQRGEQIGVEEFAARHPRFADQLRRLLPTALALTGLVRTSEPDDSSGGPTLSTLGDFRLLREIGRGGMGTVYEAEQLSLGRRVALKILPFTGVLDQRQLQRFKNEARAAATLDHPHIVHVHAVGQDRGVHYYAMQLIEGQSLAEFLSAESRSPALALESRASFPDSSESRHAVSPSFIPGSTARQTRQATTRTIDNREYFRQVARWGIEAAEALDYAHQMGIVHRDIKPSNLLINVEGKLWVADFGLAITRSDTGLTMTGDILGTLRYMSPEQVHGEREIIDQRTDVYSLGITLYELLARRAPFSAADRAELLRQVEQDDPPRPPLRERSVPTELELIVLKATNKEPAARYLTAQALADDLQRYLHDQPIHARPATWGHRAAKWARRHKALVRSLLAASGLSLVMAVIAAAFVTQARQQTALERIARQADAKAASLLLKNLEEHEDVTRIQQADRAIRYGELAEARQHLTASGTEETRGFEWHYLWRQTGSEVREIGRHNGTAYGMAQSPDGKLLATHGQDGVRVWNLDTHQQVHWITAHIGDADGVCFSPDGRLLATTGDDGTARIWDMQTWKSIATLQHTGPAGGGSFSPDGKLYLTAEHNDFFSKSEKVYEILRSKAIPQASGVTPAGIDVGQNVIRVWETDTWTQKMILSGHAGRLGAGDGSDDGSMLATGDGQGVVNLWRIPQGTLERTIQEGASVSAIDFAHHHPWIATAGFAGTNIWNISNDALVARLRYLDFGLRCIAFSPDDHYLLSGGHRHGGGTGSIHIWKHVGNGVYESEGDLMVPGGTVWSLHFLSRDEVAFTTETGIVGRLQLPRTSEEHRVQMKEPDTICHVAISPDGRWLARTGSNLTVQSLEDLNTVIPLESEASSDCPLVFSPDGKFLVSARGKNCYLWETATWKRSRTFPPAPFPVLTLALQDGSNRLYAGLADYKSHWWDAPFQPRGPGLQSFRSSLNVLSSARTKRLFRLSRQPATFQFCDTQTILWERELFSLTTCAFSPDESQIAVGRLDGSIEILDCNTGETISHGIGRSGSIEGLAFSPDGRTLASHSDPHHQITFWHVPTGRELLTINPGLKLIRSLEFSSDGQWLVAAGQNLNGYGEVVLIRGGRDDAD